MTEGQAVKGNNGGNHAVIQTKGSPIFLREDPLELFSEGQYRRVPMMAGVTKHEGSFFLGSKHFLEFLRYSFTFSSCLMCMLRFVYLCEYEVQSYTDSDLTVKESAIN